MVISITNSCALYGGTTYVNSWLPINFLIILISLLAVAMIYSFSTFFATSTRERMKGAARSELTQAILSIMIIVILLGAVTAACTASSSISSALTGQSMNPFSYATYYVGNLALNTGLNLLTNIYGYSVEYAVAGTVYSNLGAALSPLIGTFASSLSKLLSISYAAKLAFKASSALGTTFTALSGFYLALFAPLVTIGVGLLFVQFIMLPVFQYTAFVVLLPVALALRSVSFMGSHLRFASNAILAIAIAMYIIYPAMIAFNAYAINWIFSTNNPSYTYINSTNTVQLITPFSFFQQTQSYETGFFGSAIKIVYPFVNSALGTTNFFGGVYNIITLPALVIDQTQLLANEIAQFLFTTIIMFVIDLAVVLGFAAGLARALNAGVEGAGSFWGGL